MSLLKLLPVVLLELLVGSIEFDRTAAAAPASDVDVVVPAVGDAAVVMVGVRWWAAHSGLLRKDRRGPMQSGMLLQLL